MQAPRFIEKEMVLAIHTRQLDKFGGTPGLRDAGLLASALAQPQATFSGELLHPTIAEQAAAYLYYLSMNHPFIDCEEKMHSIETFSNTTCIEVLVVMVLLI